MASELEELLVKLDKIRVETRKQIVFLKEDTSQVDLTELVDLTAELEEIMLNPSWGAKKNYPQLITNFLADNPLTINALEELDILAKEFEEFLRS